MQSRFGVLGWFALFTLSYGSNDALGVDFDTDIVPVLTKSGCNSGACHGAAVGRGGFKLSLYGADPRSDYEAIALQQEGRRVNLASPSQSLVILKPTEQIEHGGGYRLEYGEDGAERLYEWIKAGAAREVTRQLIGCHVRPVTHVMETVGNDVELGVTAEFDDGLSLDVTAWTVFTAEDPAAVQIDRSSGRAKVVRHGRHIVVARYLDRVMPVELIVPFANQPIDLTGERSANFVDDHIQQRLATLRLPVSPRSDDATFVRRIHLDLTGSLPSLAVISDFADDRQPDKRERLVQSLIDGEPFVDYWTYKLAKLLRIRSQPQDTTGARVYHEWLRDQVQQDVPFHEITRQLLLTIGDSHTNAPANFHRSVASPREQAEFVSELFMGVRLRCANCHNHPLDRWTQDDYHGLAAVFAKLQRGRVVRVSSRGQVNHPRTGEAAIPKIPGQSLDDSCDSDRSSFTNWLTTEDNPYFARAIVNRIWKSLMGPRIG